MFANALAHLGCQVFLAPNFVTEPMLALATHVRQGSLGVLIGARVYEEEFMDVHIKGRDGKSIPTSFLESLEGMDEDHEEFDDEFEEFVSNRKIEFYDMEALYVNHLKDLFDLKAIRQQEFVVDAMNGASQRILQRLFPNASLLRVDTGNPEQPTEAILDMDSLSELTEWVKGGAYTYGFALDSNGYDLAVLDSNGNFISEEDLTAMLEEELLEANDDIGIVLTGHIPEQDGLYIALNLLKKNLQ